MPKAIVATRTEDAALTTFSFGSLTARMDPRRSWNGYLAATGLTLAVFVATLDPAVSQGAGPLGRLLYWAIHFGLGLLVLEAAQILLGRLGRFGDLPPLVQILLSGALGSLVFALISLPVDTILILPGLKVHPDDLSLLSFLHELRDIGGVVILSWVLVNMPRLFIMARQDDEDEDAGSPQAAPGPAPKPQPDAALVELLARLPRPLGHDIAAMSAEAHYLRVHTALGEALVLMSFGRAVDALAMVPGQVVHRSHWVAYAHVERVESRGDTCLCILKTGLAVPVSRTHRQSLRAALAGRAHDAAARKVARLTELKQAQAV